MKDLSVSHFKATIAACLREVRAGETIVITEHKRPVAVVRAIDADQGIAEAAPRAFTLDGSAPRQPHSIDWSSLLEEERGFH